MKREIKFRAWDGEKMTYWDLFSVAANHMNFDYDSYTSIMQYTGLKDKNGIEIYEGDVCMFELTNVNPEEGLGSHAFADVNFQNGCYHLEGELLIDWEPEKELEIIGNIHENPELLK